MFTLNSLIGFDCTSSRLIIRHPSAIDLLTDWEWNHYKGYTNCKGKWDEERNEWLLYTRSNLIDSWMAESCITSTRQIYAVTSRRGAEAHGNDGRVILSGPSHCTSLAPPTSTSWHRRWCGWKSGTTTERKINLWERPNEGKLAVEFLLFTHQLPL
jgi:hypothetical protein